MSMNTNVAGNHPDAIGRTIGDSFLTGIAAMLVLSVVQRVVGLGRNIGFCHYLSDVDLGHWSMANSFFIIAAPIVVLGLPGTLGKFSEYYRLRGCWNRFVTRILLLSGLGLSVGVATMLLMPQHAAWCLYGESMSHPVILWTAITFFALTAFNVVHEVVLSVRQVRIASLMQFLNATAFAIFGIAALALQGDWTWLLPGYSLSCLLALIPGLWILIHNSRHEQLIAPEPLQPSAKALTTSELLRRILPFAAALWFANLLSNLFDLSDRYMLLHLCQDGLEQGQGLVGQYYCGRIIPNLLFSLALMLQGMLLPYLSMDWEQRNWRAVGRRMEQVLSGVSIVFTALAVAGMVCAPLMFEVALCGRFHQGQSILALSLVQTIWASLSLAASAYLLCAEKGRQNGLLLAGGLVVNIAFNFPMIYYFDLFGAVLATTLANLLLMMGTLWRVHREGCKVSLRTLALCMMPACLLFGPTLAMVFILAIVISAGRTDWILTAPERIKIDQLVLPRLLKFGIRIHSLWPVPKQYFQQLG